MTTSQDPDEIRAEIEQTRAAVSEDVNRLADQANPKNIARRQVEKVKGAATDLKERVMGSDSAASLGSAGDAVKDTAAATGQTVVAAPDAVKGKTRGNPLAAGVIAFGAGLLVSSLIPASRAEQRAVSHLQDNLEPVKAQVAGVVRESADNLREPARDAVAAVRDTASEAADTVRSEGSAAAEDVRTQAQESKERVQDSRQS